MNRAQNRRVFIALLVTAVALFTACGRESETFEGDASETSVSGTDAGTNSGLDNGEFGDLGVLCQPGDGGGSSSDPGVTDDSIQIGTFSDPGFEGRPGLNQELFDTAEAFTSWCNEHGGINGREIDLQLRDAKLTEFQPRVIEACDQEDFMTVGGGAVFDDTGQVDRLACGLPTIPAYAVTPEASGADLSIQPLPNPSNELSIGSYQYLAQTFPDTIDHVGIFAGSVAATQSTAARAEEAITDLGWDVVYHGEYSPLGETSWRPFLEAMRASDVQGLIYVGEPGNLGTLLSEAESLNVDFDWVSVDANAYDPVLTDAGGTGADGTYVRSAVYPFLTDADASGNLATEQYRELMSRYDPDGKIAYLGVQALSAWLLFATAANECGADLTRDCVWEKAGAITEWTGGGLHVAADLTGGGHASGCWGLAVVEDSQFLVADIDPTDQVYVCDSASVVELTGDYGAGVKCANPEYEDDPKPSTCAS